MSTVSVIVPAFNASKYIVETLDSIRIQTLQPFEVIVINDGSTDNTVNIVKDYSVKHNYPIAIYDMPYNKGIGAVRQKGAELAKGNYVAYLSADDVWMRTFLQQTTSIFKVLGSNIAAFSVVYYCDKNLKIKSTFTPPEFSWQSVIDWALEKNTYVNFSGVVIPKWVFNTVKFDTDLRYGEDLIFLLDTYKIKLRWQAFTQCPIIYYRLHSGQGSNALKLEMFELLWTKIKERLRDIGVEETIIESAYLKNKRETYRLSVLYFNTLKNFIFSPTTALLLNHE